MSTFDQDNTPSFDKDAANIASESRNIETINDDASARQPDLDNSKPSAPEAEAPEARPVDPRKAKMDEIAARSNERRREEQDAVNATFGRPETPPPVALKDDDHVDLKVRRQTQRMTVRERNEILRDDFDDEDIQGMTEAERNRNAQFILANRSYRAEIDELKRETKAPQPQVQVIQPQTPVTEVEPPKTARQIAEEKLDAALEALEFGEPNARAAVKDAQNELARVAAEEVVQERDQRHRESVIDRDFDEGRNVVLQPWSNDPIVTGVLNTYIDIGLKAMIAQTIDKAGPAMQAAFARNGITPEFLQQADTKTVTDLYKDMILKGHQIPQPSRVIRAIAENTKSRIAGITRPAPQDQHPDPAGPDGQAPRLDRSARKEATANQPGRASLPRSPSNSNPPPMSEQDRAKANREAEKQKRRGIPVR